MACMALSCLARNITMQLYYLQVICKHKRVPYFFDSFLALLKGDRQQPRVQCSAGNRDAENYEAAGGAGGA
jgi:hypothetical protein